MFFDDKKKKVLQLLKGEPRAMPKEKYALVLEGGGAKGSYEAGVMCALEEMGIEIEAVVGTSIGALNGALIAQKDFAILYDLWYNIKPNMLVEGDEKILNKVLNFDVSLFRDKEILAYVNKVILEGGLDISPLKRLIDEKIDETKVRQSTTKFGLVTVSLSDMAPMQIFVDDIPQGHLRDYLIASAYLPVFKQERLNGKWFLDGGFYNNFPIEMLVNKGYKKIIGIELNAIGRRKKTDVSGCDVTMITPQEDLGGVLELSAEKARYNMSMGYYDAIKHFYGLKGKKYYIKSNYSEQRIVMRMMEILQSLKNDPIFVEIKEIFGQDYASSERLLFEGILPQLMDILKFDKEASYEDLLVGLLEFAASHHGLDKFRIYTLEEFIKEVESKRIKALELGNNKDENEIELLSKYLKGTKLYFYSNKEDVLLKSIDAFISKAVEIDW